MKSLTRDILRRRISFVSLACVLLLAACNVSIPTKTPAAPVPLPSHTSPAPPASTSTPTPTETNPNTELVANIGGGPIRDILFTPEGNFILVAYETGIGVVQPSNLELITFWNAPAILLRLALVGQNEIVFLSETGQVGFVGFDPLSGALSASPRPDLLAETNPRSENPEDMHLAASPDGRFLALAGEMPIHHSIQVWNLESRSLVWSQTFNASSPDELSFSSDSQYLLVGDSGIFFTSTENNLIRLADGEIVWSGSGQSLLMRGENLVYWPSPGEYRISPLTDPDSGPVISLPPKFSDGVRVFSSNGSLMAHIDWQEYYTWIGLEEPDYQPRITLLVKPDSTPGLNEYPLYFSNAGILFAFQRRTDADSPPGVTGKSTYKPLLVDTALSTPLMELDLPFDFEDPLPSVYCAPDGMSAVYAQGTRLVKVDFSTQRVVTLTDPLSTGITALAYAPDGKTLVVGGEDFVIRYLDPAQNLTELRRESLQVTQSVAYPETPFSRWYTGVTGLAFWPDGKTLAATTSNGALNILDAAGGSPPVEIPLYKTLFEQGDLFEIYGLAIAPDGANLATGGFENAVRVWQGLPADQASYRVWDDSSAVTSLAYGSNGQLAVGSEDGFVRIWQPNGVLERSLRGHAARVNALAWAGDDLVSASEDGTVRFWRTGDGAQTRLLTLGVEITSLALDGRGELLAIGTQDGRVYLWDMGLGRWLGYIPSVGVIRALAFSPDSTQLALASTSGRVQLWRTRLETGGFTQFPAVDTLAFSHPCQLFDLSGGFKSGEFISGSQVRLSWGVNSSGDCSASGAVSLREIDNSPGLHAAYQLNILSRRLNLLQLQIDVTVPESPGTYQYAWELTAPDGQAVPISASLTVIPASGAISLPAPVYYVSESQTLMRLETDGRTLTPLIEAPVDCMDVSPTNGHIAYLSRGALWLADVNGGSRRELLPIGGCPTWSPDGKRIGFTLNGVKVIEIAGGTVETLARDLNVYGIQVHRYKRVLDWSPDSNKFVAGMQGWEWFGLTAFNLLTNSETRISGDESPSWSLDGEHIYTGEPTYYAFYDILPFLERTNILTGEVETLLGNSETDLTGALAPIELADGRLLAYVGQAASIDQPPMELTAAYIQLENPGQFTYEPNPHPIPLPAEVIWWRTGSAALVKLGDGEVLVTFPFSSQPNVTLPVRGTDLRWNRFGPVLAP